MATLNVDSSAHAILTWAKAEARKTGNDKADISDGIRWMREEIGVKE